MDHKVNMIINYLSDSNPEYSALYKTYLYAVCICNFDKIELSYLEFRSSTRKPYIPIVRLSVHGLAQTRIHINYGEKVIKENIENIFVFAPHTSNLRRKKFIRFNLILAHELRQFIFLCTFSRLL